MSRIQNKFKELNSKNEKALIAYVMLGYPKESDSIKAVKGLISGGADIIEIGFPFSDPLADGPIIQNASNIALSHGIKMKNYLTTIQKIRKNTDIPIVLMTYSNILFKKGFPNFLKEVKKAGIDGIILPDMSIEESEKYVIEARKNNLDTIFLVSPNTTKERLEKIAKKSSGFLYLVAVYGTTGVRSNIKKYTLDAIQNVKRTLGKNIPVGVGFGISTPKDVKKYVVSGADAVIVGSAFLKLMEKTPSKKIESVLKKYTSSLKKATKR